MASPVVPFASLADCTAIIAVLHVVVGLTYVPVAVGNRGVVLPVPVSVGL